MGLSRQEYWSGLPFPSPEDLPDPGIKPESPTLQADSLPFELQGRPLRDRTTDSIIMNHFQTFEKFHGFLFKETHDVDCLCAVEFAPRRHLLLSRIISVCHNLCGGLVSTGIWCIEARGAAEDLPV